MPKFQIAGRRFELEREAVERELASVLPEPINEHYVIVGRRRYPPKQALSCLTGVDRADFTTHQARRIFYRLGFVAARRSTATAPPEPGQVRGPFGGRQAEALRPHGGQWVALGEQPDEVIAVGPTAQDVVSWLARHGQRAHGIFRVPGPGEEPIGLAPL
jgi:hypothetical protein